MDKAMAVSSLPLAALTATLGVSVTGVTVTGSSIVADVAVPPLLSLAVNPDGIFERFGLGCYAAGDFERLKAEARVMMEDAAGLERMQEGCARFVAEMHDNRKETEAFLAGLRDF